VHIVRGPLLVAVLGLSVALLAPACGGPQFPRETHAANARNGDPWLEGQPCPEGAASPDLASKIEDVEVGSGTEVQRGDTVRVHYTAKLPSGAQVNDSRASGMPIELVIGSGHTICGFDRALVGMRPGGQRKVTVPAKLAFGEAGRPPDVPPQTDLVFVIDLFLPADSAFEQRGSPVNPIRGRRR
jgi:FKBP-type peptidyl-prolyl cis-trans isomerase